MRSKDDRPESFTRTARKAQIVACAIEVIAEVGYQQASIRKIADRVGIAMSAVLYHFGSKDNLVDAIVEHMYRMMLAILVPALDAETTATGKLNAYIRSSITYFATHRSALVALTSTATSFQPSDGRRFDELGRSPEITSSWRCSIRRGSWLPVSATASSATFRWSRRRWRCVGPSTPWSRRSCVSPTMTHRVTAKTWSRFSAVSSGANSEHRCHRRGR